jgi:hypothetical protein
LLTFHYYTQTKTHTKKETKHTDTLAYHTHNSFVTWAWKKEKFLNATRR